MKENVKYWRSLVSLEEGFEARLSVRMLVSMLVYGYRISNRSLN